MLPIDGRAPVEGRVDGRDPVEGWVEGRDPVEGRVDGRVPVEGWVEGRLPVDGWVPVDGRVRSPVDGRVPALGVSVFDQPPLSCLSQLPFSLRRYTLPLRSV